MGATIKARFSGGMLRPLEPVPLREGDEVTLTIASPAAAADAGWLERTAGGWAGLIDAEALKRGIYESRKGGKSLRTRHRAVSVRPTSNF